MKLKEINEKLDLLEVSFKERITTLKTTIMTTAKTAVDTLKTSTDPKFIKLRQIHYGFLMVIDLLFSLLFVALFIYAIYHLQIETRYWDYSHVMTAEEQLTYYGVIFLSPIVTLIMMIDARNNLRGACSPTGMLPEETKQSNEPNGPQPDRP